MTTSLLTDSIEVQQIKQAVEKRWGRKPASPADFAEMSLKIKFKTGQEISADTLSRLWGYKKGYPSVRRSVVNILNAYAHAEEESEFLYQVSIQSAETKIGERVRIAWLPNRICVIEYVGQYQWRVVEAQHSKLQAGDTFSCRVIAQGQALIVDHLRSGKEEYAGYVIGGKSGLSVVEKI